MRITLMFVANFTFMGILLCTGVLTEGFACSCMSETFYQALERSDAIFMGTVIDTDDPVRELDRGYLSSGDPIDYTLEVYKVWKGKLPKVTTVRSARYNATCGYNFKIGETYLVFAWLIGERLHTGECSHTESMRKKQAEIEIAALNCLTFSDFTVRTDRKKVSDLIKLLESDDQDTRRITVYTLRNLHMDFDLIIPALIRLNESHYLEDGDIASLPLVSHRETARLALPVILKEVEECQGINRLAAMHYLDRFLGMAVYLVDCAVPTLKDMLEDENKEVRLKAVEVLSHHAQRAPEAIVPVLIQTS